MQRHPSCTMDIENRPSQIQKTNTQKRNSRKHTKKVLCLNKVDFVIIKISTNLFYYFRRRTRARPIVETHGRLALFFRWGLQTCANCAMQPVFIDVVIRDVFINISYTDSRKSHH